MKVRCKECGALQEIEDTIPAIEMPKATCLSCGKKFSLFMQTFFGEDSEEGTELEGTVFTSPTGFRATFCIECLEKYGPEKLGNLPRFPSKNKYRNQPCPCGSGSKFKYCCWGKLVKD